MALSVGPPGAEDLAVPGIVAEEADLGEGDREEHLVTQLPPRIADDRASLRAPRSRAWPCWTGAARDWDGKDSVTRVPPILSGQILESPC